jgi:hypothetical protein
LRPKSFAGLRRRAIGGLGHAWHGRRQGRTSARPGGGSA